MSNRGRVIIEVGVVKDLQITLMWVWWVWLVLQVATVYGSIECHTYWGLL